MRERFGEYELLKLIATGGMAEIYLAQLAGAEGFSRRLVVKRMLPQLAVRQDFVAMFLDEARLAANLVHPNIVQVFNLGEVDGAYFMAMELVDGPHLGALFAHSLRQRKPLPVELCVYSVARAADGLHYAHEQNDPVSGQPLNLVHRDISPQNILVSRHGDVKVTDFGVAKAETQSMKTRTGIIKGKVSYMSPEQCLGDLVDRQTDVFALGIVLYELLTRRRLYREKSDLLVMQRITSEDVVAPSSLNPSVDAELDEIALRALSREKSKRYATAGDLADALDVWAAKNGFADSRAQLQRWLKAHGQHLRVGPAPEESISQPRWRANTSEERALAVTSEEKALSEETLATPALGSGQRRGEVSADEDGTLVLDHQEVGAALGVEVTAPDELPAAPIAGTNDDLDSGATLIAETPQEFLNFEGPFSEDTAYDGTVPAGMPEMTMEPEPDPLELAPSSMEVDPSVLVANHDVGGGRGPLLAAGVIVFVGLLVGVGWWFTRDQPAELDVVTLNDPAPPDPDPAPEPVEDPIDDGPPDPSPAPVADGLTAVTVRTVPGGATVLGPEGESLQGDPLVLRAKPGEEVELTAYFEGQPPVKKRVKVGDKPSKVEIVGKVPVKVTSDPVGAALVVDGENWGTTPKDSGVYVDPGKPVRIQVGMNGYVDYDKVHTPKPGEPLVVNASLRRQVKQVRTRRPPPAGYGTVQVNVRPWAHVLVDGTNIGATPTKARKVRAGKHNIKVFNKELGFSKTLVVNVNKNQNLTVGFIFKKKDAGYKFESHFVR